jgi:vacuolar-type H+-ATPase subunit I/STV1
MPYAPGITYTGGESIARGIESLGQSVGQGLAKLQENSQKAKSLRQVVKAYNPDLPTDHMSLGDLEGMVQGEAIKQAQRTQSLAEQLKQEQLAVQKGHLTLSQQQQAYHQSPDNPANVYQGSLSKQLEAGINDRKESANRLENFNRAMSDEAKRLGQIGLNLNANDVMRLAAQTGTLGDQNVDRVLSAQTRWGGDGGGSLADVLKEDFTEDPETGQRFVKYGKQILPSGARPITGQMDAVPVRDADGKTISYVRQDGRGRMVSVNPMERAMTAQDRSRLRKDIQEAELMLPGIKDPAEKKRHQEDIDAMRSQLRGETTTSAAGSPNGTKPAPPLSPDVQSKAAQIRAQYRANPTEANRQKAIQALEALGIK